MKISNDTEEILKFLDYSSDNNLRKRNDISVILELGATFGEGELVTDIILSGASLWNINKALSKKNSATEGIEHLKSESLNTINTLTEQLTRLIGYESEEIYKRFEETYFRITQGTFRNLVDLAHDLFELKKVINQMKHSK